MTFITMNILQKIPEWPFESFYYFFYFEKWDMHWETPWWGSIPLVLCEVNLSFYRKTFLYKKAEMAA